MSGSKDDMMRREDDLAAATAYLVSIDRLNECEAHGTVYGGGHWDLEGDFYKRVMYDRGRGEKGPIPWALEMKARDFTDLLKEAYDDHPGDHCAACAKNLGD